MLKCLKRKITRKHLQPFIEENASDLLTLDLGCSSSPYKNFFPNRIGLDLFSRHDVDVVGDAQKLAFGDNKFDVILCTEVLEHLKSPLLGIKEMQRVLKPFGKLVLTTRFSFPLHDTPHDYWRFSKYGLMELFKDWDIIELREETSTMECVGVILQRIAFQCKFPAYIFNILLLMLAKIFSLLGGFIQKEYGKNCGDATCEQYREGTVLTSGYYMVCKKREK